MGKPEPISVIRSVAEPVAAAVAATSPRPFADDSAGGGYFESDHHHRYIATAIFRELAKGHGLVLLCGEHTADVDLVERFLNEEGRDRYRASLVRCRPEMDFGALVRAYNRRLGLRQEAGSDGIWALLSHLMAEVRKGVRRLLVLENAESLDLTCFDELLRFMRLDEPHVMPVVLLGSADFAERLATPAFGFLNSAITGRVPFDRIESEEVGAFLHYQLNVLPGDERALFPPEIVNLIAVRAGGSAAVINRLALDVLEQGRRDAALAAPPEPPPAIAVVPAPEEAVSEPAEEVAPSEEAEQAEPLKAQSLEAETLEAETLEAETAAADTADAAPAEADATEAEPLKAEPPPRLVAGGRSAVSAMTQTKAKRRARLSVRSALALYVVAAVLAGLGLLYFLAPRAHEPSATVASTAGSAETPITAAPDKSSAAAPTAKEAPSDDAAAQAAAVEPAAGPAATPPASAPQAVSEQNGPVVIGAKIVPFTAPAPAASDAAAAAASAPATPAAPEPTASASAAPSPSADSTTSASAAPAQPPVASAAPQPAPNPPAAPAPSRTADVAPASEAAAQPASHAPSEAAAAASSEAATPAMPKAGTSTASAPVPATKQPASPAPAASGATQAIAPLAALEPAKVPSQEQKPPPQPQPPKAAHPDPELTLLVQRGDELLAAGDIYSARQFYERAAQAGDPAAQCGLGKSYDPVYLRQLGARGVAGDAATAAGWYRRAAAAGNNEAAARLARLDAADPNRSNSK
jgi:type II secretory pathway predicted ATPase ExeA/TPR repeat protein